ncbi:transposase [Streptomyces griseosporeus]|uniref:transposase n=1 Tax=Streptomyces griseosporeus TaxID=1910 RepID=UPI0036F6DBA2
MSTTPLWKIWRRSLALAAAAVAVSAGVSCTPGAGADAGPDHRAPTTSASTGSAQAPAGTSECGSGGNGGKGGDSGENGSPGKSGEPGKPGTHDCTRYSDLPDKPKDKLTLADKVRVVLVLLNGGATEAQIAEKYDMPKSEVGSWKKAYLEEDWSVLAGN